MNKQILYIIIFSAAILGGCTESNLSSEQSKQEIVALKIIDIPNAKTPLPNVLTGGQPTLEQFEQAAAAGYKTVINLRTTNEAVTGNEAEEVAKLGMQYVAIPIAGKEGLSKDNADALMSAIQKYSADPVIVHCGSGNRVGALFAIDAKFNKNQTVEEAIETGVRSGLTSLEPAVRAYFDQN